jgi:hypothetical protein
MVTEQLPTFTPMIFDPETLQRLFEDVATETSKESPLLVVNPAAAAASTNMIFPPRFTNGEPITFIGSDVVVALPLFGVIFIFTMHLPGATPEIFSPDVMHTDESVLDTEPVTLEPCGMDIFDALMIVNNDEVAPVLTEAVFAIGATTVVGVGVGVGVGVVGVTGAIGATGVPVIAFEVGESPIPFSALMVTE